jgi:hypothetical protein
MRRLVPLLAAAALAGGCGSASPPRSAPKPPRLPRTLAQSWAQQADAVASALAAGDGCTAQTRANALQQQVIAALNEHRVPAPLRETLSSGVNDLAGSITCTPPAPTPPEKPPKEHGKDHPHDHGKGHDKHGKDD